MNPSVRRLLWGAGVLVLLANAVALAGVAWNRSGEPEASLMLTERELQLPARWRYNRENSGLALALRWRVVPERGPDREPILHQQATWSDVHWLDADKLVALGFELDESPDWPGYRRSRLQQREVWLALELDGPAHARSVQQAREHLFQARRDLAESPDVYLHQKRAENAEQHFVHVRDEWSRLVAIDADLDAGQLRARHPDREHVAIVRGRVRPGWRGKAPDSAGKGEWRGHIEAVSISSVHVPRHLRQTFDPLLETGAPNRDDHYQVTLAWGRRLEPWIVDVRSDAP